VVFVPRGTPLPGSHLQAGAGIGEIRNLYQALLVLGFALGVQDVSGAEQIVAGMERRFDAAGQRPLVARARAVVDGLHAYHARDYERAVRLLAGGVESFPGVSDVLARSAIFETRRLWMADDLASARNMAVAAVRFSPGNVLARYNASAIAWWQRQRTPGSADESWRADLEALAQMPARPDDGSPDAAGAARALLSGRSLDRPPLLVPLEP
jgi:hypothetical protein